MSWKRRPTRGLTTLAAIVLVAVVAASQAGARMRTTGCATSAYSYAGLQASTEAGGVSATLAAVGTPTVTDGHVGGWIGVGGPNAGPGGKPEWIQVGFASFSPDPSIRVYYEVAVADASPRYVELARNIPPGERHALAVSEVPTRSSWWRVWVDGRAVSAPIHLPGSHQAWSPQALAENWNGGTGACNTFAYRFSNVRVAGTDGGWRPLRRGYVVEDAGYRVLQT